MSLAHETQFWVYMLASRRDGAIDIGMTNDLAGSVCDHRDEPEFAAAPRIDAGSLVWVEPHRTRVSASLRERQLRKWKRTWKIALIEGENPDWLDLCETLHQ